MNKNLELRAYSLCLYQLSHKQGCIQSGHAVTEVGVVHGMEKGTDYNNWACNYKTIIHLNGGTSDMLTASIQKLREFGVDFAEFREPDLYNVVTAVGFIVDERVFDEEKYPSFKIWLEKNNYLEDKYSKLSYDELKTKYVGGHYIWDKEFGIADVSIYREWLKSFKLF